MRGVALCAVAIFLQQVKRPSLRHFAKSLLLLGGALLVSLALAEVVLRVAGISFPVFDAYDEMRGVALKSGKQGWYQKEGRAYLRINSFGYRDSEHTIEKPAGTYRIAVLGDSFSEARQVAQEDTFWSLMERGLGTCPALEGRPVEVLNFGIGSYGTTEELLTWRKDAIRFSPDLVLLQFFLGNDLHDNSLQLRLAEGWRAPKPAFVRANGKLVLETPPTSRWRRFLYTAVHYSRLLELVNEVRRIRTAGDVGGPARETRRSPGVYAPPVDAAWREAWAVTEAVLDTMNREVRASGARFAIVVIPTPEAANPDARVPDALQSAIGVDDLLYGDRRLADAGKTSGFPVVSVAQSLRKRARATGTPVYGFKNAMPGHGHLNEAGHRQMAIALVERLCGQVIRPAASCAAH